VSLTLTSRERLKGQRVNVNATLVELVAAVGQVYPLASRHADFTADRVDQMIENMKSEGRVILWLTPEKVIFRS
jgi:hypothetical protein